MKLKCIFEIDTISRINPEGGRQIYPHPGKPSPPGVGVITTGRYTVEPNRKGISGEYIFTRTNSYQTKEGDIVGNGTITYNLRHRGSEIKITSVYTIRFTDVDEPFSVVEFISPVASATVDGKTVEARLAFRPIHGGLKYAGRVYLKGVSKSKPEAKPEAKPAPKAEPKAKAAVCPCSAK